MFEPNIGMENLFLIDRNFSVYLTEAQILQRINEMAIAINKDFANKNPLFLGVLNGSFMFAADFMKNITIPSEIQFIKLSSYSGTQSTGNVKQLIGLNQSLENRTVIILEDIIDTGLTFANILQEVSKLNPKEIIICTLLFKPKAVKTNIKPNYIGFNIENKFVIGYGLDYNEQGRNLRNIYAEIS